MFDDDILFSAGEAAAYMRVSRRTLNYWMVGRCLPHPEHRIPREKHGPVLMFSKKELKKWYREQFPDHEFGAGAPGASRGNSVV
jgi:hypothetical protein